MKKAGKLLVLILCITLAVGITAAVALTSGAQVCAWTLYVDGAAYTGGIQGVSVSGNTVTLTNFSGRSIAAIPGGFIGDDDAPVLNIVLVGENSLSGSFFTSTKVSSTYIDGAWYGGIYAYTREGGSGDDSIVNISGSGSLSVNYAPIGKSISRACNYKAICCGDLNIRNGAKVKINYMPRGIAQKSESAYYTVRGVDAYNVSMYSGILDIKVGSAASINNITKVITPSYADVYGIDAYNIYADNFYGYLSVDLSSNGGNSKKSLCTSACLRYSGSAPVYLINKSNGELKSKEPVFGSGVWVANKDYRMYAAAKNTGIAYEAYGPVIGNEVTSNSALKSVELNKVIAAMKFPKIGDKQLNETTFTKNDQDGFYSRETSYLCDIATGQSYLGTSWSEYAETPEDRWYEFDITALPLPGYWYIPGQNGFIDTYVSQCLDFYPEDYWVQFSGVAVCYRYGDVEFVTQPQPVCYTSTDITAVAEAKYCNVKYEWFVDIYDGEGKKAKTMSMDYFDEMNYGFTGQNNDVLRLGSFDKDEKVPGCEFTFAEASKFELYCVASGIAAVKESDRVAYYPFGHDFTKTAAKAATCTAAGNCEYYKCGVCGNYYSDTKGENKITLAETVISAKGHAPAKVAAKAATCTAAGNKTYYSCKNCKKAFTDAACTKATTVKAMTIAAKGHSEVSDTAVKATLSKNGKTAGIHCATCGKIITAQKTVYQIKTVNLSATKYTYNGKVKTPTVTVKDSKGKTLVKGTDYTVTYASGRKAPGKYAVKITFKGKYSGSKTLYFTIAPKQVTGVKVASSAKKTAKVTFTKATGATGYQVYYSTKKTSGFKKLGSASTNSYTYKKLTSGKTYYFKVRAYKKTTDGTVIYGAFSTVVARKIK